jgi:hypothetical protein
MKQVTEHIKSKPMTYFTVGWFVGVFPFIFAANLAMPIEMQFATATAHENLYSLVIADKCTDLRKEWYQAMEIKHGYEQRGEAIPDWLIEKIAFLDGEIARFCSASG